MPDSQTLFSCEFEFGGKKLPEQAFEAFAITTAALTGVKGRLEKAKDGVYKGKIEGQKEVIEKFQQMLNAAEQFKGVVEKAAFKNMQAIKEFSGTKFEIVAKK